MSVLDRLKKRMEFVANGGELINQGAFICHNQQSQEAGECAKQLTASLGGYERWTTRPLPHWQSIAPLP